MQDRLQRVLKLLEQASPAHNLREHALLARYAAG
jgi:hypothetical protein